MRVKLRCEGGACAVPFDRTSIGWADGRGAPQARSDIDSINPEDVSGVSEHVRHFYEGALVGMFRALRARKVLGNVVASDGTSDPDVFLIEPNWDGSIIPSAQSAAQFCFDLSNQGYFVIAPVLLAYDTSQPQLLWRSKTDAPARDTEKFAVLLPPYQAATIHKLAFHPESGG